jgi:two-component system chemotaxis sensor kinase CheA
MSLLLQCGDYIGELVDAIERREEPRNPTPSAAPPAGRAGDGGADCRAQRRSDRSHAVRRGAGQAGAAGCGCRHAAPADYPYWHLSLQFNENVLRDGLDPLSFLHYLRSLGRIVAILPVERHSRCRQMDAESCYLGVEICFGLGPRARRWRMSSSSCATTAASTSCRHAASCRTMPTVLRAWRVRMRRAWWSLAAPRTVQ